MKRIAILVVLVLVIATSLALTASIASAQPEKSGAPGWLCPEKFRPAVQQDTLPGPQGHTCVPTGTRR
jgi:hypothetical protein